MYTTKMKPEITIKLYANFFNICGVKSFENVSDEKIEILKQKATELKNQFYSDDIPKYLQMLLYHVRNEIKDFDKTEKVMLLILVIDPECITWKLYNSAKIPSESKAKETYEKAKTIKEKKEGKLAYEEALRKKSRAILNLSSQVQEKIGLFIPSIIQLEKLYLKRNNYSTLKRYTNKDNFPLLNQILEKINLIKEIPEDRKEVLDKSLKRYQESFPEIDINLLIYHIFVQPNMLEIKNINEQLYFLINASQLGYENDETLASIYQYYCTWDAMNEELKRVYGYTSTSLLKLQGHYNTIYNIKGDF